MNVNGIRRVRAEQVRTRGIGRNGTKTKMEGRV
jgi:hypothetical protein